MIQYFFIIPLSITFANDCLNLSILNSLEYCLQNFTKQKLLLNNLWNFVSPKEVSLKLQYLEKMLSHS